MFRVSRYLVLCFCLVSGLLSAAPTSDYTTLKKFLAARMYAEAYYELLKCELNNKSEDPKLSKLKKDLLPNARKEATNRSKVRGDDPLVFTVLADLDYQENQLERGKANVTKALNGDSGTLTNYVFAKLLFAKGNMSQAADAMEKALAADPGLETVFEDFQFLYHCKNYGLAAAKRLSPDPGFLVRAKQVSSSEPPTPPDSPFENDPTRPPEVVT
ncbi:MAG TPA: hypothetical protein PKO06_06495, partial [Candidatus Ozemobacteraceae bacterium]|nr:hypothetical protein [Candidatus Ozemobacteraceae bacterium]